PFSDGLALKLRADHFFAGFTDAHVSDGWDGVARQRRRGAAAGGGDHRGLPPGEREHLPAARAAELVREARGGAADTGDERGPYGERERSPVLGDRDGLGVPGVAAPSDDHGDRGQ